MKEKGLLPESQYKCRKNFSENSITVWDSSSADRYQYYVDMNDLAWELNDSTATVFEYECNLATADYHGRKWKAWFALDVPVQDGPWQLCGLPGLIMKAETDDRSQRLFRPASTFRLMTRWCLLVRTGSFRCVPKSMSQCCRHQVIIIMRITTVLLLLAIFINF